MLTRQGWWAVHATRMIIASLATLATVYALGLTVELSAVISAIVVTQSNIGGSLRRAFEQGVGSFVGAAFAAAVALALRPDDPASTALALAIALLPLSILAAFSIGFLVAPVTASVVILGAPGVEVGPDILAVERLVGVAIGCGVGLLAAVLVLPAQASRAAMATAARVAGLLAAQMRAIAPGAGTGEAALSERATLIRRGLLELATHATEAARERRVIIGRKADPERALRALRRIRHDVDMLRRAARGAGSDVLTGPLCEPWDRAAMGSAGALDQIEALLSGSPIAGPPVPIEPIVRDYRTALDEMRNMGLTRDMSTPDLARLFGIKFALRQLERDLADLMDMAGAEAERSRHWES